LRCDPLQRTGLIAATDAAASCASALGASRGFYTVQDSADDIEAVRQALGADTIALVGFSHGARVAMTYARRYPDRVDRLLLLSPPGPAGTDLLYRSALAAIPDLVRARCPGAACRRASRTPVADVVALAQRLERGPIAGAVVDDLGRRRTVPLTGFDLFQLFGGFPIDHELPGFVHNARRGDVAPLLRALRQLRWYRGSLSSPAALPSFSMAAYAASTCEEAVLPWSRSVPVEDRDQQSSDLAFGTPGSFFPFGPRTALQSDLVELCRRWPVASAAPVPPAVLPAIPTLILAPTQNLDAPLADAAATAQLIPGARLLKVPGPNALLGSSSESCSPAVIRAFLTETAMPKCRPRPWEVVGAVSPPPLSLADVDPPPGTHGRAGRTVGAVRLALRDGASALVTRFFARLLTAPDDFGERRLRARLYGAPVRAGALRRGAYRLGFRPRKFVLRRASYVPGIRVSGTIAPFEPGERSRPRGHLRVSGAAAAHGRLTLRGRVLSGRLGGRRVEVVLGIRSYPVISFGR
jgi:pimeloyl-ACP methyl ester carboxylesterase